MNHNYTAAELRLMAGALSEASLAKQREANSRRWIGDRFANIRAGLRRQSKEYGDLAIRVLATAAACDTITKAAR